MKKENKQFRNIAQLTNWDKNPRTIDKAGFNRLVAQLERVKNITGEYLYKPLLITPDDIVIGGNMRLRALKELGVHDVWVNVVNVKNEQEMIEIALSDNDQAGKTEKDLLLELIEQYPEISLGDYAVNFDTPTTLEDFMDQFKEVEEDEVPEVSDGEAESKLGEVYQLGRHRLMCGDAMDEGAIHILTNGQAMDCLYTDPPYGMDLNTNYDDMFKNDSSHKDTGERFEKVIADDKYFDPTFLLNKAKEVFLWGADYFYDSLPRGGSWSSWDKRTETLDDVIGNTTEFLWSKIPHRRMTARVLWSGHHGMGQNDDKERIHPTQKPIGLHQWFFDNYGNGFKTILDLFGGSGSTLIACEQTNRTCYMMELDPKYCDVIRKRYENFTKK